MSSVPVHAPVSAFVVSVSGVGVGVGVGVPTSAGTAAQPGGQGGFEPP